ncbi:hypothetical protein HID58_068362 [Brassica napus]|uniref:Uncharacterized protein n=3 Tax=Brassica TaxID=3705 RepID=A0ABQ7ZLB4_BRANA|nr:PREDICTED: U1 small nuclear ribonucleoprotein C-like [Brassica oleracea var. oleracea]XP_013665538.1 U1 small nuclear ribonucleoprotein C [Brassica napus]KAG2272121.1 hypothetical protein Bca52824_066676 [Brassica carinata]KAH0880968.1 hypothetical protein HID58_068362 [Brassica napus]CDY23569.1 BnaC05g40250D [Brassica napus]
MLAAPPPMDFSVDMSCDIKVNNSCELCNRKVNEVMQSLTAFYSVTYLGENNTIKLKARANPNVIMGISHKYGDHGKITNFHMNGQPVTPQPGGGCYYGPSGYNLPSNAPGYYPYPSPYAPPPQFLPGNYGYPWPNPPPPQKESTPQGIYKQHTAPPAYVMQPPPPMPLSSYSYIEPPYWPMSGR